MSNTITNVTPKLLAQGVMALRENAVYPRLVNRGYESMAARPGNVINIPIPSAIAARAITPSVTHATNVDSAPTVALVTLDYWYESPFHLSDSDALSVQDGTIPMQAGEAVKSLANSIDAYIAGKHTGFYGFVGTAGTTPLSTITDAISCRTKLNQQVAPMDDRRMVLDPSAEGNALALSNILQFDQRGDQGGIIRGSIGQKLGMDWYMDQNQPTFTIGTAAVTGWSVATGGVAADATTITVINATASGTILVGDVFALAGGQQYVVRTAVTVTSSSGAGVNTTLSIYPAVATAGVSGAVFSIAAATNYVVNLAFHRDAFAWASRPLADVSGLGNVMSSPVDPVSGIALRLEISRQYRQNTFAYDVLGGANVIRRELGVKLAG